MDRREEGEKRKEREENTCYVTFISFPSFSFDGDICIYIYMYEPVSQAVPTSQQLPVVHTILVYIYISTQEKTETANYRLENLSPPSRHIFRGNKNLYFSILSFNILRSQLCDSQKHMYTRTHARTYVRT